MVLRFYPGGPQAVRGTFYWTTRAGVTGCDIAESVGAPIPRSTYRHAYLSRSQNQSTFGDWGVNDTALLPIEE